MIVNENRLDEWVRGNRVDAQGVIVELVWRLVSASAPAPVTRRFPLGDSLNQPGPDGELDTEFGLEPWVPEGRSYWEIGVGGDARGKASDDYRDLTEHTPEDVRLASTFVFVTPLSGVREWRASWEPDNQLAWKQTRLRRNEWKSIKVIDGTQLVDWMRHTPAVELWLANRMGLATGDLETLGQRWEYLHSIGDPPPLSPSVFLASREVAGAELKELLERNISVLRLEGWFPDQVADFAAAYVAKLPAEQRVEVEGQCLVVATTEAWNGVVSIPERVVLVTDAGLDLGMPGGVKLLEKAKRQGHGVVYWSLPGGVPHPNGALLPNPTPWS